MPHWIKLHLTTLSLTIMIFAIVVAPIIAHAGELVVLIEGVRSLTVGTDTVNFGSHNIDVQNQIISGVTFGTPGMIIDDMQSGNASWSVTVSADNFSDGTNILPYTNMAIIGDNDGVIEATDGTSNTDGITLLNTYQNFSGNNSQSEDITLISADNRDRTAEYTINPEMKLTIPGGTLAGNYSNTLTITFLVN